MIKRLFLTFVFLVLISTFSYSQSTVSDTNASSGSSVSSSVNYEVNVPKVIRLTSPADKTGGAALSHSGQNSNQSFSTQEWRAGSNILSGASFSLEWDEFVNQSDNTYTRPAKVSIGIKSSSANWDISSGANSDTSDIADRNDSTEVLDAESTKPGNAKFNVDITFIEQGSGISTVDNNVAPSGVYLMTLTGTITAN